MENFISNYVNISNPITKFFNKIDSVSLYGDYSKKIECLEAMKKVPLYVKNIIIFLNNEEESENLADPNLHNTPISNLKLILKSFEISSKTIENLKAIYPNSITIKDDSILNKDAHQAFFENYTKLLSNLDQTSLEMNFNKYNYIFKLELSDVIFKVLESKKECSYIRAKSVEIRCTDKEFCWIKSNELKYRIRDLNMRVLDSYYLYLNKSGYINISEFIRIKDLEEIKEVEKMFNNESLSEINKGIIIPMKYSNKIFFTIKESHLFEEAKVEENQKTIEVIPHIKDIKYEWFISSGCDIVSEYLPLLPARTKYDLYMGLLDLKKHPDLDEKLRMLNWNDKRIDSISCRNLQ